MQIKISLSDNTIKHLYPLAENNRFDKKWGEEFFKEIHNAMKEIKKLEDSKKAPLNDYFVQKLL